MKQREVSKDWDFIGANTKEYTHCYHIYPAMMIPQIARKLIKEYAPENTKLIFDPYCGTGTTMVEAKLTNIDSAGTDLNPLAQLISRAKIKTYDIAKIQSYSNYISDKLFEFSFNTDSRTTKLFDFHNIEFWFSSKTIKEISFILNIIKNEISIDFQDFYLVALSETLREASFTRNSEFKLYRMTKEKMEMHNPDTFGIFLSKIHRNTIGLKELIDTKTNTNTQVFNFNTCDILPREVLKREIDFILTSPPYGDSRTTVAYGQFSRLSNQWLGVEKASKVDNTLMGGNRKIVGEEFKSKYASEELGEIKRIDLKRYYEVESFLIDYKNSINNVAASVRKGGRIAYVVGNRTVKGVQIPLDYITVELFESKGFTHLKTIVREIPNKRMPKENSPTNKQGIKSKTMSNEYIVIMEKE